MSLDSIILLNDIEKKFSIEFSTSEAESIITVQDLSNCVFKKLKTQFDNIIIQDIEQNIMLTISESQGIPIHTIRLNQQLTNDLGID